MTWTETLQGDLFGEPTPTCDGLRLLRGFVADAVDVLTAVEAVVADAPFRHMMTPGGHAMSVAMSNCGQAGWVADRSGYRYTTTDPLTGELWPDMPEVLRDLAERAAAEAGFSGFTPDACLINRYIPGARMGLHQDINEDDRMSPIVSLSLGLPATFLFGGLERKGSPQRIALHHGDVVVWGGPMRMAYHGIAPLKDGVHPLLGQQRLNLTFRKAL